MTNLRYFYAIILQCVFVSLTYKYILPEQTFLHNKTCYSVKGSMYAPPNPRALRQVMLLNG